MTASIAISVLTVIGSVFEGVGILLVAGRFDEARKMVSATWAASRSRVRDGSVVLERYFRPRVRLFVPHLRHYMGPGRGIPIGTAIEHNKAGSASMRPSVSGRLDVEGRLDIQIQVLKAQVDYLAKELEKVAPLPARLVQLEERIPMDIAEGVKDPWRGIGWLGLGLACLAGAGIIGAFT